MEFIIHSDFFNKAISDVSKAVSLKTPFPILSGIKITANEDGLVLVGSNSDIIIEKVIPLTTDGERVLEVIETGSVVLAAKHLSEIVKKLPDKIYFTVNKKQIVTLKSNEIITRLNCFNSEEYPRLPILDESKQVELPCIDLIEMIKQTAFAASKSETRPVLTGVNMIFKENQLTCVATNSHRLALRELTIDSNLDGSIIIPSTSLNELIKLINNQTGLIQLFVTDSYIVFKSNDTSLYSRLLEGNYPNVSALIPETSKTTITLDTKQLLKGMDRACLFASEWKNNNVNLEIIDATKIKISSNSSEIGRIEETQNINSMTGELELNISLDGNFLMDALKVIRESEIRLSFGGSMRPVLIEPVENSSYLHLISPVRTY
ncbi:DNA polymerase III subunit beta [Bacillus sp. B1-b2]|uniref:DNA polymerase III subunit beta n=1 Tax=Bacillus sp. B1-b2 TaxID=2653201 RepID=UPI001261B796|nr:DNA polymerase III subunit beta [Bacillus sp. B1-b2]KAB7672626.1 DNA polymerase III subunit beta [Bacillus sp. B1-b2]